MIVRKANDHAESKDPYGLIRRLRVRHFECGIFAKFLPGIMHRIRHHLLAIGSDANRELHRLRIHLLRVL